MGLRDAGDCKHRSVGEHERSGTNQLRGAFYEFFRDDALDARNYYDTGRQPYKQNQFGGTIGGPIVLPKLYNGRGLREGALAP
jgi:hypothetical protein